MGLYTRRGVNEAYTFSVSRSSRPAVWVCEEISAIRS